MAELRELLHEASPPASGDADLDDLRRRVRRRHRTRRAVAAMVIVGAVPLLGVAVAQLRPTLELLDATRRRIEFFERRPEQSEDAEGDAADAELRRVSERDVVLEGDDGGGPWMMFVWLAEDQTVCIELRGVSCGSLPRDIGQPWSALSTSYAQRSLSDEVLWQCAYGMLAPRVDRVRLDLSDGTSVELEPATTALEIPARFYGHCWRGPAHLSGTTALDAQGDTLDHVEHAPPDNPPDEGQALEPERVRVPEVEGSTLSEAEGALRAVGLSGGPTPGQGFIDPTDPEAVVVSQEPPAGVEVWPGAVVGFRTALVTAELCDVLTDLPPRRGDARDLARTDGYWEMLRRAEPLADPPLAKAIDELLGHHERDEPIELAPAWGLDSVAIHHDACSRGMR